MTPTTHLRHYSVPYSSGIDTSTQSAHIERHKYPHVQEQLRISVHVITCLHAGIAPAVLWDKNK